jgi:hypothetical protein
MSRQVSSARIDQKCLAHHSWHVFKDILFVERVMALDDNVLVARWNPSHPKLYLLL